MIPTAIVDVDVPVIVAQDDADLDGFDVQFRGEAIDFRLQMRRLVSPGVRNGLVLVPVNPFREWGGGHGAAN